MTAPISPSAIAVQADDVLSTQSEDLTVLMSMDTGKFVELNDTGRAIWDLTDGTTSVAEVTRLLSERYEVDAEACSADVTEFYQRLAGEELVAFAA